MGHGNEASLISGISRYIEKLIKQKTFCFSLFPGCNILVTLKNKI